MNETLSPVSARLQWAATWARIATAGFLLAMYVATHMPVSIEAPISHTDKLFHFFAYMTLSIGMLSAWEFSVGLLRPPHYFTVWLVGTLYGVIDEITQIPVGRTADGVDWLCDVGGILMGLMLFRLARPFIYRFI